MHPPRSLLLGLAIASTVPAVLLTASEPASASGRPSIAALATANIGKRACSENSLGGRGFASSCTGDGGEPEYWCADFARWVWAEAGVADTSTLTAAAGSFYVYGLDYGTLSATPAVGDVAVFNYYGEGVAQHVALVTAVNPNGTIETASGDWGGENGSETQFASTSSVFLNAPAYVATLGGYPASMGMTVSAFVAPVGVPVVPVMGQATLAAGQTLSSGDVLTSPDGLYSLEMQTTGDLAEYASGRQVWTAGTEGHTGDRVVMQTDGNLVVYSSSDAPLWSSATHGHPGSVLGLEDNGTLAIQAPSGVLWSRLASTDELGENEFLLPGQGLISANGLYTLDMQRDGNLVEYTAGRPLWSSVTAGDPGARAVMQADGNFVVYSAKGTALWSSHTGGHHSGHFSLALQGDAALDVLGSQGVIWSNRV